MVRMSPSADRLAPSPIPSRAATALLQALVRRTEHSPGGPTRRALSLLRKAWLAGGDPPVAHRLGGRSLLLPLSHDLPVHQARHRDYSRNLGRVVAALRAARPAATVVDIGANVGDSALIIREQAPATPILCIEGDDHFLPFLRANVGGLAGVEIAPHYVRHSADDEALAVVRAGGTARLVAQDGAPLQGGPGRALEAILAEHPAFATPGLIKVDTDGHDADILVEAEGVLAAHRPIVFFELDPALARAAGGRDPQDALDLLARLGYRRALFFTNTGSLAFGLDGAAFAEARARTRHAAPGRPVAYFDVCAFGPDDAELAAAVERRERSLVRTDA